MILLSHWLLCEAIDASEMFWQSDERIYNLRIVDVFILVVCLYKHLSVIIVYIETIDGIVTKPLLNHWIWFDLFLILKLKVGSG